MKILGWLLSLLGLFLLLYAGYAFIIESSPLHSADYFGLVFMIFFGIPGIILLTLGILFFEQRHKLFKIFAYIFLLIFLYSLFALMTTSSYMRGQIFFLGASWLAAGGMYMLFANFLKSRAGEKNGITKQGSAP